MSDDGSRGRRLVRRLALIVFGACVVWLPVLLILGGFDFAIGAMRIRSNNPRQVLYIAALALCAYLLAGGRIRWADVVAGSRRWLIALARRQGAMACVLAILTMAIGIRYGTRTAFGADAYGYVSQADLWLIGAVRQRQPWIDQMPWPNKEWVFSPPGYRPVRTDGAWAIVPTYSPGVPMLMAVAKFVGGQCALFGVVPVLGGLAVLATYGLGRRLGSPLMGLTGAWFVATSPAVLGLIVEPLSDVPAMAAWAAAWWLLLGEGKASALGAGFVTSAAILIRPNLFPLAGVMTTWFFLRPHAEKLRRGLVPAGIFLAGVLPGILAVAAINAHLYGSAAASGYGSFGDQFAWARVWPNAKRYFSWYAESQSPIALLGMVALAVPLRRVWPAVPNRSVLAVIGCFVAVLWAEYCAYLVFESWGFLRFLLPSWPFLMVGLAAAFLAFGRLGGRTTAAGAMIAAVGLGLWTLGWVARQGAFNERQAVSHDMVLGQIVQAHTEPTSVVITVALAGSVRYYSGRMTARYDYIDPAWLDRFVDWMRERHVHVYALLDTRELQEFKTRFSGQRAWAALDAPVIVYKPVDTGLFDLTQPVDPSATSFITSAPPDSSDCDPPIPASRFLSLR